MAHKLKTLTLILFAAVIAIASGGINLYQHYCACSEFSNKSVIVESPICKSESEYNCCESDKEIPVQKSCCENDLSAEKDQCGSSGNNCCQNIHTYLKTDDYSFSYSVKKSFEFIVSFVSTIDNNTNPKNNSDTKGETFYDNLPPPLFGKNLLCSLHQLKLDIPLA